MQENLANIALQELEHEQHISYENCHLLKDNLLKSYNISILTLSQ